MYFLLGTSLILAFVLIVNVAAAAVSSGLWRVVSGTIDRLSPSTRARVIIALRVMPVVLAVTFVLAFVAPSYLLFEPHESGETVGLKIGLIATASSLAVLVAVFRVLRTWYVTRRLLNNWLSNAAAISVEGIDGAVYKIEHPFPVIGVIGIIRPRVFIASQVLKTLDDQELAAAIDHENGHRAAYDNLKRGLMRVCRDLVILPIGFRLDTAWAAVAESAADEYAAQKSSTSALDLASALVKIAKLVPRGATPALPAGAYLVEDGDDIASRVEHLVEMSETSLPARSALGRVPSLVVTIGLVAVILLPVVDRSTLDSTHTVVETFVHLLQ